VLLAFTIVDRREEVRVAARTPTSSGGAEFWPPSQRGSVSPGAQGSIGPVVAPNRDQEISACENDSDPPSSVSSTSSSLTMASMMRCTGRGGWMG